MNMTPQQAKESTQAIEREILGLVPAQDVVDTSQNSSGVLLTCAEKGAVRWTGGAHADLADGANLAGILELVRKDFAGRAGFSTQVRADGPDQVLDITYSDGSIWIVGPMKRGAVLSIVSGSACFPKPDDVRPGEQY
ncbi:hypothetical protein G3N30_13645 [Microbacterium lacticum]|uniref:hypothetical protein n=1 Tax=Microbacterium lacticum TaxID=33885 RepID=UPI0018B0DE73|nr:hypothetical protein [Microbacterium lacticum]MBF9337216.1 hypothetical protein [Microbacterium lacticum]